MLEKRFRISKAVIGMPNKFDGCMMEKEADGEITMSMKDYDAAIPFLQISRDRREQAEENTTDREYSDFKSLAGSIMWLGEGVSPKADFLASNL